VSARAVQDREADLFEDFLWLVESGESVYQAARRCGRSVGAITKAAERAGRLDVARRGYGELRAARQSRRRR